MNRRISRMAPRRALLLGGLAVGMMSMVGAASAQTSGRTYVITMADMSYDVIPSGLKVGDTINWVNHDTVQHTVTARDHSFDLRVGPGQSVRMNLKKEGVFAFYCTYHSMMRGTLKVSAK